LKKYKIIYADPPWKYRDKLRTQGGGAERKYPTMMVEEIAALPISKLAADDAVLFLWVTWPHLFSAETVIRGWGFKYKTLGFVWIKLNQKQNPDQSSLFIESLFVDDFLGMGTLTRSNSEVCLLATRGKPVRVSPAVRQTIFSPVLEHSRKPDEVGRRIVELLGPLPRVELFARARRPGWDVFGNQVEGSIQLPKGVSHGKE
jgi:N6-adenosine-specific RNA methylase IME4